MGGYLIAEVINMLIEKLVEMEKELFSDEELMELYKAGFEGITHDNIDMVKKYLEENTYKEVKEMIENNYGSNESKDPVYQKLTKKEVSITEVDELDKMDVLQLAKADIEYVTDDNLEDVSDITGKDISLGDYEEKVTGVGKHGHKHKKGKYIYYAVKLEESKEDNVLYEGTLYARDDNKNKVNTSFVVKDINGLMDVRFPKRNRTYRDKDRDYVVGEIYELVQKYESQEDIDAMDEEKGGDE